MALLLHTRFLIEYCFVAVALVSRYVLLKEIEVQEMRSKTSMLVAALCTSFMLSACVSNTDDALKNGSARIEGANTQKNSAVYRQSGMEISAITSRMADALQQNMFYHLLPEAPVDRSSATGSVKIVTMPRLAITSFVDTDTYENAGYLGRALAEFFTNEMSNRAFEVTEYKLTGKLSVTNDGDFILSRNWKKIAKDTNVKYLLGGTLTRNNSGVVVVSRIINMQTRQVIATATDIVPYAYLPACYRTSAKNCSFTGSTNYLSTNTIRTSNYYKTKADQAKSKTAALAAAPSERTNAKNALTRAQVVSAGGRPLGGVFLAANNPAPAAATTSTTASTSTAAKSVPAANSGSAAYTYYDDTGKVVGQSVTNEKATEKFASYKSKTPTISDADKRVKNDPRFKDNVVVGATSRGNYDVYREDYTDDTLIDKCTFNDCIDPVVYPANTYVHNTMLVRDTADESSYKRIK